MMEAHKRKGQYRGLAIGVCAASILGTWSVAEAQVFGFINTGKVVATQGVSITDGAAGGGVTPWAVIAGYETRDGIDANVHYTYTYLPNYTLNSVGGAIGFFDRVEVSFTNDTLPTGSTFNTVGLLTNTVNSVLATPALKPILSGIGGLDNITNTGIEPFNTKINMNIVGAKVRLYGDAIYNSDDLIPQIAVGGFYKWNSNKQLLETLGAKKADDFEVYGVATKVFFPISTLFNVTARYSSANETGLTGFGGPSGNHRTFRVEGSVAYLLRKDTAIGGEYAQHSHNLHDIYLGGVDANNLLKSLNSVPAVGGATNALAGTTLQQRESDWFDFFFAFFPSKNISFVFAYAALGDITLTPHQTGFYLSMQAGL